MPTLICSFTINSYKAHLNVATSPAGMNLWLLKNLYPMSASNVPDTTALGDHTHSTSRRHFFDKHFTFLLAKGRLTEEKEEVLRVDAGAVASVRDQSAKCNSTGKGHNTSCTVTRHNHNTVTLRLF